MTIIDFLLIWSVVGGFPFLFFMNKIVSSYYKPNMAKALPIAALICPIGFILLVASTSIAYIIEVVVETIKPWKDKFWKFIEEDEEECS